MKKLKGISGTIVVRITAMIFVVVGVTAGGGSWWAWRQSRHVPEFYTRARNQSENIAKLARKQIDRDVALVRSQAATQSFWNASFSEEEINAWLQSELPERFSRLHRGGVSEPAIAIQDGQLFAAARYSSNRWNTVVSCKLSVQMTEEPNLIAIALSDLKAGALPLPLEPFVRKISKEAAMGDLDIRWDFTESGPIALVTIPEEDPKYALRPLVIESINLVAGQLQLAGRNGTLASTKYSPRGDVHRFVSYRSQQDDVITR